MAPTAAREPDGDTARMTAAARARAALAAISVAASPAGAALPSSAAVRMAIVVVVLTLNGREVPSSAYTTVGTSAVYSPSCTGSPAIGAGPQGATIGALAALAPEKGARLVHHGLLPEGLGNVCPGGKPGVHLGLPGGELVRAPPAGQVAAVQQRSPAVFDQVRRVAVRVAKPLRKPKTTFAMFEKADEPTSRMEVP